MISDELKNEGVSEIFNSTQILLTAKNTQHPGEREKIISADDAYYLIKKLYVMNIETQECFFAVMMNSAQQVIGIYKISSGGINSCTIDPRLIFCCAINCLATKILLCHNHTSGNVSPSREDILLTKRVRQGADLLSLKLIDHLIISDYDYYSFADEGQL